MDLVLQSESKAGVLLLLRDFVMGRNDDWILVRLLAYAAAHSRSQLCETVLTEFESFLDDKNVALLSPLVRNSAVLTVSTLVGKMAPSYANKTRSGTSKIQRWHNKFFNALINPETSHGDKVVYIHALHNLGYANDQMLDAMLQLLNGETTGLFDDDLKIYVVQGLKNYKDQNRVIKLFLFYWKIN